MKLFSLDAVFDSEEKNLGKTKQAGTAPNRRHIQGSKIAKKDFQVSSILFYSTRKSTILRKFFFRKNYILKKWSEWRAIALNISKIT